MTRHELEDRAAGAVGALVRRLPHRAAVRIGRAAGALLGDLDRRHVRIAEDNLAAAFPDWDRARRLRTARGVYRHFGGVLFELLWLEGRSAEEIRALVNVVGGEHVRKAQAHGRGIVFATAHMGNWELQGVAHGLVFGPVDVVARPLDNPLLDARLCALRTAHGNRVLSKRRALGEVLRTLRGGGMTAIAIDQNVQEKDGIFVDFFGRAAATTTVAAAIAVKTGAALVGGHAERQPDGRYRLYYDPALEWTPSGSREADIERLTQAITSRIETWVRQAPEQWLWMHRRWKTRPPGEAAGLPQPTRAAS
jgi:KDO2-lipid IV(A) lauroyltransferase